MVFDPPTATFVSKGWERRANLILAKVSCGTSPLSWRNIKYHLCLSEFVCPATFVHLALVSSTGFGPDASQMGTPGHPAPLVPTEGMLVGCPVTSAVTEQVK